MPSVNTSGTQAATLTTEHTLATITSAGTYLLAVDANAMVNGDVTELRIYIKTLSGSTSRVAYYVSYAHIQGEPVKFSVPVPTTHEFKATLKQQTGTGRSYDWEIIAL